MEMRTPIGLVVRRTETVLDHLDAVEPIIDALDTRAGVVLVSSYEYPGRYTRWDIGFVDPPLKMTSRGRNLFIEALNERGKVLIPACLAALDSRDEIARCEATDMRIDLTVNEGGAVVDESMRSRRPSVFSVLRALLDGFRIEEEPHLGFYGAFGYDLAFQFDAIDLVIPRADDQRDLVLYLPDAITLVDRQRGIATKCEYEFSYHERSTDGLERMTAATAFTPTTEVARTRDMELGGYSQLVREAKDWFRRGALFEVVPGQTLYEPCPDLPSEVFRRLRTRNPAPYGAFLNLGESEYLVGASPEMFLRCEGRRIETCPISGTIARGDDALGDAEQIFKLLSSGKELSELTMCTDVDRNDKSRVCEPGSVQVIGRRQLEMYSRLIHTVDHVEGYLAEGFDALDAFLSHAWAVTVTGAPKLWAMRFIESHEQSPRHWYGGALGAVGFNGSMNTGLTLRTLRIKNGVGEIRVGATLLIDSDPDAEERETELKAAAIVDAIRRPDEVTSEPAPRLARAGDGKHVLLIDHEDSFVNTLAGYFRREGASVVTIRVHEQEAITAAIKSGDFDVAVLSPGPGTPAEFHMSSTIEQLLAAQLPIFGVCLGLQGIAEYFGATLGTLEYPMHGRASTVEVLGGRLFTGLPSSFSAGRYHSLFVERSTVAAPITVTALSEDGIVMAIEHESLPVAAVQFHPESIMTLGDDVGHNLISNVLTTFARHPHRG